MSMARIHIQLHRRGERRTKVGEEMMRERVLKTNGRRTWRLTGVYFTGTQGLIFVIDSNDRSRIDEARQELHRIILDREMKEALLLVFANKQDIQGGESMTLFSLSVGWEGIMADGEIHFSSCEDSHDAAGSPRTSEAQSAQG